MKLILFNVEFERLNSKIYKLKEELKKSKIINKDNLYAQLSLVKKENLDLG